MADMEEKTAEMARGMSRKTCSMKAEMKKLKAESYVFLAEKRENIKHELHLRNNANQRHQEVKRRLNIYEDVSIYLLSRINLKKRTIISTMLFAKDSRTI